MKNILVKQNDIKDCGVCCLESIIKYYDGNIPIETLRLDTRTDENGVSAYNLIKTSKKYGFDAYGMKIDELEIREELLPAIAHIVTKNGYDHFVVVYKITKNTIYVMNPAKGYEKYSKEEFYKLWTNIILLFKPFKKIPQIKNKNSLRNIILNCISNNKKIISKILVVSILLSLISILLSYYFKISINSIENSYFNTTLFIIIVFFLLNVIKISINHYKNTLSIYFNKNIDASMIPDFINHIFKLPLNVIKGRTSGEIVTRLNEMNNIKSLFSEIIISVLLNMILIISSTFFLYCIDRYLFLILCIISILYIIVGIITSPIIIKKLNDNIEYETDFNSNVVEKVDSIETIKNLNIVDKTTDDLTSSYIKYLDNTFNYNLFINNWMSIRNIINDIGLFLITSYGIYQISKGNLTLILLITFNSLLSYFLNPIEEIINIIPNYLFIKLSINKINEFLNIDIENVGNKDKFYSGDIIIKNVCYSYNNYDYILNNIDLTIKDKTHLCIGGESGCGKSTLCKLICRNIDDYTGAITINDINIKDYSINTIRNNILYVSQREKLFTATIKENILLGSNINKKVLDKILKITKVDEILDKKSLRLESLLIDSGYNLSGGERQRLILARSLVKRTKILILDESLSEVDPEMELDILKELDIYLKDRTLIYISHSKVKYFKNYIEMSKDNDRKTNIT